LISWTDADIDMNLVMPSWTVFKCYLSALAGTAVARDYVEFPSQILERGLKPRSVKQVCIAL
jgi:hypothetical protein